MTFIPPDNDHFRDILFALRRAREFTAGWSFEEFSASTMTQSAVQYQLMIAGEAVKRLSTEARAAHPNIQWAEIAGMRDVLIHAYHRTSAADVWRALQQDAVPVIQYLEAILGEQKDRK